MHTGFVRLPAVLLVAVLTHAAGRPELKIASPEKGTGPDGAYVVETGPVELRLKAPGARRTWLYYEPDAGEVRKYFLRAAGKEFRYDWQAEPATGGRLYLAAEDGEGKLASSEPLRVVSASYKALHDVVSPDPHIRIEVNLPAFELGVFRGNELLRRFRIGIGLKSWPAPPGLRVTKEIVWNPAWAPPNSPWATPDLVRRLRARGEVLGRMKIPLGGEILIHGTSRPRDLGRPVSHGCLRMLNRDIARLAAILIAETGAPADLARIRRAERQRRYSYHVGLPRPVLVVVRYEPVVLRAGKVVEYPDVYGWVNDLPARRAAAQAVADSPKSEVGSRKSGVVQGQGPKSEVQGPR